MKPVDLQLSVRRSQDAARAFHVRDKAGDNALANIAAGFRKDLEQRQSRVSESDRAVNTRIEDGEHGNGGGGGDSHQGHEHGKKDEEKARDPRKGQFVDITAGFLA